MELNFIYNEEIKSYDMKSNYLSLIFIVRKELIVNKYCSSLIAHDFEYKSNNENDSI